jgi:hypothetical protein
MNEQVKGYILITAIVGTSIVTYNAVSDGLNSVYKPDENFDKQKAAEIKNWHKVVAGYCAIACTSTIANFIGRTLYKA